MMHLAEVIGAVLSNTFFAVVGFGGTGLVLALFWCVLVALLGLVLGTLLTLGFIIYIRR